MSFVTKKFVEVFDIQYGTPGNIYNNCTYFGFKDENGDIHYSVSVPGKPKIEAGMTVTAILNKENDWQHVRGWFNHTTQEIVADSPLVFGTMATSGLFALALLYATRNGAHYDFTAIALYLSFGLTAATGAYKLLQIYKIKRSLRRLIVNK